MYYEVSNVVFNHKLNEWEISHRNPFAPTIGKGKNKRQQSFFLTKDKPKNLLKAYQAGHCIKPHAFKENGDMFHHTIILDFDNLTKIQYDFVKAVVNGRFEFIEDMCGDDSAGMKTWKHQHEGIEGAEPEHWKYKVFFPVQNCLSTYEDVDSKFKEAVAFFNPFRSLEEVEEVWGKWRKANNRKDKITDPIFKDWILPDVAMANSTRHQITYSVNVNQQEKMKVIDDDTIYRTLNVGMEKFSPTNKYSYSGLDWKIGESKPRGKKDIDPKLKDDMKRHLTNMMGLDTDPSFHLPISKAGFARLLHQNHFDDLVLNSKSLSFLLMKMFKKRTEAFEAGIKMDDLKKDAALCGKVFARIAGELRVNGKKESMAADIAHDIIRAFREINGQTIFSKGLTMKKDREAIIDEMSRSFASAWGKFIYWRTTQKLLNVNVDEKVIEARDRYRDSGLDEDRDNFFRLQQQDLKRRWNDANLPQYNQPYDYHRKGAKQEIFDVLIKGEIKLENEHDFIERMNLDLTMNDGEYSKEFLSRWYVQYKTEWNKTYPENKIGRVQRKGKWSEMFKDKTKEEIADIIDNLEVSKQMRHKLRTQYLNQTNDFER